MRLRVVCGLSDTMAILAPTMRLRREDLPAFGRPMSETNPAFTSFAGCHPLLTAGRRQDRFATDSSRLQFRHARNAHLSYTPPFGVDHLDVQPVDVKRLADGRHVTQMTQEKATNGFEPFPLDGHVQAIGNLVDIG